MLNRSSSNGNAKKCATKTHDALPLQALGLPRAFDPGLSLHGFSIPLRVQLFRRGVVRYSTELYELFEHAKNVEDGKQNDLKRILMVVLSGQLSPQHFTAPKVYLEATSRQTSSPEDGACEEDVSAPFLAL